LFLTREPVTQALPLHERHHVVRGAVDLPGIDETKNMGMLQCRDGLDLPHEAVRPDDSGQLRTEDLDRHPPAMLEVFGEVHCGHAALAQLPLDLVAVGKGGGEAIRRRGHRFPASTAAFIWAPQSGITRR
jgi:hypothetical protein